ncbi:MAG: H-NS family nucleoid-associated regulatory protein [Aquabacterium sp.]
MNYQELSAKKAELERQAAELEKQIKEAMQAERAGVIAKIRQMLADNGLTVADLMNAKSPRGTSANGTKVAPKYKDPATGSTWSGRGLKPKWVQAALADGKSLDDLKV